MFNDFFNLRRGVDSYLNDLSSNKITFRRLVEDQSGNLTQKEESYSLDEKHLVEYCSHIIKHTITNLLKVVNKHNIRYSDEDILIHWSKTFQENIFKSFLSNFLISIIFLLSLKNLYKFFILLFTWRLSLLIRLSFFSIGYKNTVTFFENKFPNAYRIPPFKLS